MLRPITAAALLLCALVMTGCAPKQIEVRPRISQCPAFPKAPDALMRPPAIRDFLSVPD